MKAFFVTLICLINLHVAFADVTDLWKAGQKIVVNATQESFTLVKVLGQGGYKTAWLAEKTGTPGERVVLLALSTTMSSQNPDLMHTVMFANRLIAKIASKNKTQSVFNVRTVESVTHGGNSSTQTFVVISDVAKHDASDLVKSFTISIGSSLEETLYKLKELSRFGDTLSSIVYQLRKSGLVHGDIKFENILVTEALQLQLTDFDGIVSAGERPLIVTPAYSAPENFMPELGKKTHELTDEFSNGVMLYKTFVGQYPYESYARFIAFERPEVDPRVGRAFMPRKKALSISLDQPNWHYSFRNFLENQMNERIEKIVQMYFSEPKDERELLRAGLNAFKKNVLARLELDPELRKAPPIYKSVQHAFLWKTNIFDWRRMGEFIREKCFSFSP